MAYTSSLSWPNMFNVAQNSVAVLEDNKSIVNRTRLLILTDPTELYNSPDFGVGLRKHIWKYNNKNTKRIIQDKIKEQIRKYEPCAVADSTQFADGLLYTGNSDEQSMLHDHNHLKMTIRLETVYSESISVQLNDNCCEEVVLNE